MPGNVEVRVARPADGEAVSRVLRASYGALMKPRYSADLLTRLLPLITEANPALLAGGTYYVALIEGTVAGCGGWTLARPGAPDRPIDPALAHVRHFATDPAFVRRGVGRALIERCLADAGARGVTTFEAYATLVSEGFYRSAGFETLGQIVVSITPDVDLPSLHMIRRAD